MNSSITSSTIGNWLFILLFVLAFLIMLDTLKQLWINWGWSHPFTSSAFVALIAIGVWWLFGLLITLGTPQVPTQGASSATPQNKEQSEPKIQQSATASGGSTTNQAGRDINIGVSEATMLMLLKEKANARDRDLAQKYPLGCVLLGVLSDGKVVYQPNSNSLKFDPNNYAMIEIDVAKKVAVVTFVSFRFSESPDEGWWELAESTFQISYMENRPESLWWAYHTKAGISFSPYIEVLDESNAIFVIGFK